MKDSEFVKAMKEDFVAHGRTEQEAERILEITKLLIVKGK